jgi:HEAT repeat protein
MCGGSVVTLEGQNAGTSDSARAAQLLSNARGTNPVMCELAMQSVDRRYGNWGAGGEVPDGIIGQRPLLEWASRDIHGDGAVPVLGAALSDDDTCVRRLAARLLGRVTNPAAVRELLRHLQDGDARTRQAAAVGLGYADSRDAVMPLVHTLDDDVGAVRAAAVWALGEIEDDRAVEALTRLLSEDPDPMVRRQAARALGNIH